jgi:mannose-1-phosphate guanylyltransferase
MKAFLLAAGLGTRLRPLTDETPKCLLPVGGVPLLGIWLEKLAEAGVTEVLVNTHYRADMVENYLKAGTWPLNVIRVHEPELLGSAGTMREWKHWVSKEEFFLACNADGLTEFPLANLIREHEAHRPDATIAVFLSDNPSAGGVVEVGPDQVVTGFAEKPENPNSSLVNAGMYAFAPSVLKEIPRQLPADIGHDLLPLLVGRMRAVPVRGIYRDIGTPEDYRLAQEEWNANDRHANPVAHRPGRWWDGSASVLPPLRRDGAERRD